MEPTILIIDPSAEDRAPILEALCQKSERAYRILQAENIADALALVTTAPPDCVILEEQLPDGSGLDFLRSVSGGRGELPFPAIIVTRGGDRDAAVALFKAGALDYFVKGRAEASSIRLAVHNAVHETREKRRAQEQHAELEKLYAEARANNDTLREESAAKDDFLAMLSHELRTPLTPVLSLVSSTINHTELTPDLRETFAMIQRNVELEARLIDDLLDLTQIASGRLTIEKSPVDVHRCIEAALDVCQESFDEKRITVRTELSATNSTVHGEFARLNQVFWNLLKNAAKFGKPNGQVTISTDNENGKVVTEIRDDGIGIEPERLATVFSAFGGLKPRPTGTGVGLGLAITRAIIGEHQGEIRAESDGKGCGAIFRISLPISLHDAIPGEAQRVPSSASLRGKTILVVEDHEDTRRVLSRALRRRGFGVTAAGSVSAAAEQFTSSRPDLIICDIGLPDGSGWDLMDQLRPHGPIRAIAVSGFGMEHDVTKSREVGFLAHLTKPIDFNCLENLLVKTLAPLSHASPPTS
jgi:signal transduction histidine kinase